MNEKELFLYYLKNSDGINYYTEDDKKWIESFSFNSNFNFIHFESPDIIIETSSKILLLEHFQFDSSKRVKKSSLLKEEETKISRDYKKMLNSKISNEGITEFMYSASFETEISIEEYLKNVIKSFDDHIVKYKDYINNFNTRILTNLKEVEFGFVIQNTSLLMDIAYKGMNRIHLTPFHLKEFRDKLKMYPQVRHIFYLTEDSQKKIVIYFSYQSLNEIDNIIQTVDDTYKITPWKPRHLRYTVFLQRKNFE